ncbi:MULTISPECIES: polymorphic toxin-type HINT domain-containing protein [Streptomyces]|uniref:Polymorphic toxin-type HINT domain-containing protein n=1 Tax=Streptomyces albidocamelliae TaxID=2981135 RepID=A0ABY6EYA3_9ACTN|nr:MULTISPECIES: polymorphic toxin-type HINT domain-containing protein [unclassified Streptomyces]UXY39372.1 polymorphic toxin-type HINT domain-containing protein [Streptomyces sp. HUAS 14-6]
MYLHAKQKIVTLATALLLTVGAGTAAAAGPAPKHEPEPTLLEIAAKVAQYSGCESQPLLERPACIKEFALKSAKLGLGVGVFLYVTRDAMKDEGASFKGLEKELTELYKLKPQLLLDPDKEPDPEKKAKIFEQTLKTLKATKPHVDKLRTDLVKASRLLDAHTESVEALAMLAVVVGDYYPDPKPSDDRPPKDTWDIAGFFKDIGKSLDQINAGFDKMNGALDDMNRATAEVNKGLDKANKGIEKANRGMDKLNEGIKEANKGLDETKKAVDGIGKGASKLHEVPEFDFDFSRLADRIGSKDTTPEERAAQERRMSLLLNLLPGIGDGKGILEAITGTDLATGEKVSGTDRLLGSLAVMRWLKYGGKLLPEDIRAARKGDKLPPCNSFPAGTRVLMGDGTTTLPIEEITVGDSVLAGDPQAGSTGARQVEDTIYTPEDEDFTGVSLAGDADDGPPALTATDHHPFWVENRGQWTDARDLNSGDTLRAPDGTGVRIDKVTHWKEPQGAYNLTVNDLHTYYVLAGRTPVLVHNASCDFIRGEIPDAAAIERGSLVKIKEKQLEKALKSVGEDPHGFKADWVGKNNVSRFDAMRDGEGRVVLVSKDGKILVPTNYRYRP